ncbi:MAG: transcription-repair coupling factor [Alphaproteobacteria bacterium]
MLNNILKQLNDAALSSRKIILAGAPIGLDAYFIAEMLKKKQSVIHIASDDVRMAYIANAISFFYPEVKVLEFPAWDTVPYDRVSPKSDITAKRLEALSALAKNNGDEPVLLITTVNAVLQKVPPSNFFAASVFNITRGKTLDVSKLSGYLAENGYNLVEQVMEYGDYAKRGGIIDVFPTGAEEPFRIDLFGDEVEEIKTFDVVTQRTISKIKSIILKPVREVFLSNASISRFRMNYRKTFGVATDNDELYTSISSGRYFAGMEHWLPLFYDNLETIFSYLPNARVTVDNLTDSAVEERYSQILEYFQARSEAVKIKGKGFVYKPVNPETMWLTKDELENILEKKSAVCFSPFNTPEKEGEIINAGGRIAYHYASEKGDPANVYKKLRLDVFAEIDAGGKVILGAFSEGSEDRLANLLEEKGFSKIEHIDNFNETNHKSGLFITTLPLEHGFKFDDVLVIAEQDILGERLARPAKRKKRGKDFINDISTLNEGDYVVHEEHGIGRYEGLVAIEAGGARHDCLAISYLGGDKLFVPIENINVVTRYGSEGDFVQLDKLGGVAWQSRKAKVKKKLMEMAAELIRIAAERQLKKAYPMLPPESIYDEFVARFPYMETDDQMSAINDVIGDLGTGRPMDRLVCGDVGFGKTEVALRAAFVGAMSGTQVAVVVPTTLLARQHYKNFVERFNGFPIRISQLSRLVTSKQAEVIRRELADGTVDIVIGTHAVLAKSVGFKNLGLLIVDEEQHFGVAHKERLKQLKSDIHVLTLTATPIPRTLQMALAGVRELSVIGTPPVDRLAVRTFVTPFDRVIIREALMRERYRGGQSFCVCPRVADIDGLVETLNDIVPELKIAVAHGQMTPKNIEDIMTSFADGEADVLVSTTIIESGLDMPSVNTMIVHRSDMFGLSQLYQLRGRVGRSKLRAYAYLTIPENKKITKTAEKRLSVMQTLDTLGSGFSLASYDMDIRGAGNLLGDEQSGHIKEVGVALYQHMLEEAIANYGKAQEEIEQKSFSPQINTGMPVLIPEEYIKDLGIRMGLYRRIADLKDEQESEGLMVEMIDRFGKLPDEVLNLFEVMDLKRLCLIANVERIEVGHKGAVVTLFENRFPNPQGLINFISKYGSVLKIKPDHKIVYMRELPTAKERLLAVKKIMKKLAEIAEN